MHIIFISTMCSAAKYAQIYRERTHPMLDSSQRFFDMFVRGMEKNEDVSITCISVKPLSRSCYAAFCVGQESEKIGNIRYEYVGFLNYPVLKSMTSQRAISKLIRRECKQHSKEKTVIICDPLLLEGTVPAIRRGKKYGIQTIGFLTDMPDYANECDDHSKLKRILYAHYNKKCSRYLFRFDKYVFLTEAMKDFIGNGKPWMLLECMTDSQKFVDTTPVEASAQPTVLYAGKLHQQFGLDLLADTADIVKGDCVFDIYGDGNYADELQKRSVTNRKMHIHGVIPSDEVVLAERRSTVLVNPRTSTGEFTKYSFPSKTAEYMLTGVPVLMFRLPGIPEEYADYVFYAEEETPEALAAAIDRILTMSIDKRKAFGLNARQFISEKKSNIRQALRVLDFIKK